MLYEEWKSRYKNLKNFNTVLQRCPRFWPLAPPRGKNPGVYSLGISEDPPRYLSSKFDASVRSDCWDISIWKTLTQCDGNRNANANVDDRGDYNSSPCTSYRRAKNACIALSNTYTMISTCAHKSNWKIDNLPYEYMPSLTTVVKKVGKSVAEEEEIWAFMKARSKIGCSLKNIFAEISVVYGSTNVSYDIVYI